MQKIYKAALGILSSVILAAMPTRVSAQASVLGTELVNGSYATYNVTDRGVFRQVRLQATSSASSGTRKWEFAT